MEKMLNEFKEEYVRQYGLYLDNLDNVERVNSLSEQEMAYIRVRWQRRRSVMCELRHVAKILGYTQEDIERWEGVEYKKHYNE